MAGLRWQLFTAVLVLALLFLQYRLWFEPGGVRDVLQLKKQLAMQATANKDLKKRNDALLLQIKRLQRGHEAAESRARNELGMIKKGETFYQVVK